MYILNSNADMYNQLNTVHFVVLTFVMHLEDLPNLVLHLLPAIYQGVNL